MHFAFSASDEQTGRNILPALFFLTPAFALSQAEQTGRSWLQSDEIADAALQQGPVEWGDETSH
jgi:hypothetical protein